ncbi:integral membrane protein [Pyricularia oryzae Y34]|uniref:Integral membrane protein n=2 Tax=Pyricularia oryzae TaxID=318829 RepID=A0AA97PNF5_PYRO3|nr:integral membrane protein [Pyricularia oryzae Y34]
MQRRDNITAAAPPPPGVTPNFAQPEDVLYTINFVTQIASMALVTPFVAMRVLVKAYISPPFLVEDSILMYKFGGGYHVYELSVEKYEGFLKALYADTLVYGLNAYFTKVALLLVIARVFNSFRKTRIITFLLVGAMAFYYAPMLFLKMNVCRPISGFWTPLASMEPGAPAPVCLNQRAMFVADTIISAITDTAVLIIPIPATVSLRMPWQRRLKVWSMLGLGGVATAASIVRLVIVFTSIQESEDQTVDFVRFNLLGVHRVRSKLTATRPQTHSTAEVGIGLICACLPAINIVFAKTNEQSAHAESEGSSPSAYFQRLKFLRGSRLQTATDMSLGTRARPTTTANEDAIEMMGIEEELQSDGTREAQWAAAAGNRIVRGSRQLGTQPEATRRS